MYFDEMPEPMRSNILERPMPEYAPTTCADGPKLSERRVALITTAGLHDVGDSPFIPGRAEYRTIASDMDMADLVTSHPSTNIDRIGILRDFDMVFPIHRLGELAEAGLIGSIAARHYSFLGSTPPATFSELIGGIAAEMKADGVDAVVLAPV